MGAAHHMLERREIQLAQRSSSIDYGVGHHTCMLLAVGGKVLGVSCANPAALDASHHRRAELTRNNRVLAEILEVATAQWMAFVITPGREPRQRPADAPPR